MPAIALEDFGPGLRTDIGHMVGRKGRKDSEPHIGEHAAQDGLEHHFQFTVDRPRPEHVRLPAKRESQHRRLALQSAPVVDTLAAIAEA